MFVPAWVLLLCRLGAFAPSVGLFLFALRWESCRISDVCVDDFGGLISEY